jgi:hypothetical protein
MSCLFPVSGLGQIGSTWYNMAPDNGNGVVCWGEPLTFPDLRRNGEIT